MAELTQQEHLQPSLLDRLTDEEPDKHQESRERRVLSMRKLRESVLRDLEWLLNSGNLQSALDLGPYPQVASSVLNYGIPDLAGGGATSIEPGALERLIRQAIWDFEPRILRDTVKVRAVVTSDRKTNRMLAFEIEGELWAQPVPLQLFLRTEVDLESGSVSVTGRSGPV